MVKIENVSYSYGESGEQGLRGVSLYIKKGECVLLCGESGCGKTTVTRLINGLIPHFYEGAFEGKVTVGGIDILKAKTESLSQIVGSVFQNPRSQFFNLDTTSEIAFGCENIGLPPDEIRKRVNNAASELGIERLLDRDIFTLSGGEKQLVAMASVYALAADIFVLDEPSSNLDAQACRELAELIAKLKKAGNTVVISEHRLHYLNGLYDRVVYIEKGWIRFEWTAREFISLTGEYRASLGLRAVSLDEVPLAVTSTAEHSVKLRVCDLTAGYARGNPVLQGVSFEAAPGEVIGIIGKNGQGKSTLARVLCGLHKEAAGSVELDGKKIAYSKRPGLFYLVMQESGYQLFTDSVEKELYLSKSRKSKPNAQRVRHIMETLSLAEYKDRHPMSLSGGQKQRTAIGAAMAHEAAVLILDEPTSGLDYRNMLRVVEVINELRRQGKIIFIITHDYELLSAACTRVLALNSGRITGDIRLTENKVKKIKQYFI